MTEHTHTHTHTHTYTHTHTHIHTQPSITFWWLLLSVGWQYTMHTPSLAWNWLQIGQTSPKVYSMHSTQILIWHTTQKHANFNENSHKSYTGKQGLKYGTVALTDLLRNGSSENSVFWVNALTFWIITPKVFIVHHWFQYSHVPKQIRNRTIQK